MLQHLRESFIILIQYDEKEHVSVIVLSQIYGDRAKTIKRIG